MYNQFLSGGKYWAVMNPKYAIINIDQIIAYNTAENSFIALNQPQLCNVFLIENLKKQPYSIISLFKSHNCFLVFVENQTFESALQKVLPTTPLQF